MIELGDALTGDLDPPVAGLFVYSANPGASNPDQRKVLAGLAREDLFTVVHEQFLTDTARFADVLLPSTMQMEQSDLHLAWGHHHVQLNRPAVPPPGECRPLHDVFQELARRVGFTEPCFSDSFDALLDQALDAPANPRLLGITRARLEVERSVPLVAQDARLPFYSPWLDGRFDTPSTKVEFVSSKLQGLGLDPVLGALMADEVHAETAGERTRFPLHFLTPASKYFMNSSLVENERGRLMSKGPLLYMTPEDAAPRGIAEGDLVRVWNDRGAWTTKVELSDLAMPGVVVSFRGWWSRWTPDGGNANQTTSQRKTDAGGGPTFYTNFVEVEPASRGGHAPEPSKEGTR
jgi:anaerobic selenocysteine-containing dehydrogenase